MILDQKTKKAIVGVYLIDGDLEGSQLATTRKPNGFKRFLIGVLLGWEWVSIETLKK